MNATERQIAELEHNNFKLRALLVRVIQDVNDDKLRREIELTLLEKRDIN